MEELEELKKLTPEERIKRLKELEEQRKKEIQEAEELIRESEEEIEEEQKQKEQIPIPQLKSVDIGALFTEEEKEIFKAKRFVSEGAKAEEEKEEPGLEKEVWLEELRLTPEQREEHRKHSQYLSQKLTVNEIAEGIGDIYKSAENTGYMTAEQQTQKNDLLYAAKHKAEDPHYQPGKAAEETLSKLVGSYKR